MTTKKVNRIYFSLQKLAIINQMMQIEHMTELPDADFRIPFINNFCKRIGSDCLEIKRHLEKSGKITVAGRDNDFVLDYSSEIWRVVDLLCGLEIGIIKDFADNLEAEFEKAKIEIETEIMNKI